MRNIIHFIPIFTFSLGIIAPACGFAWGGNYSVVEICNAQGIESRIVQDDDAPTDHQMNEKCQFCFASSHLNDLIPVANINERVFSYQTKQAFVQYEITLLSRFTSHEQPRGPPPLV